MCYAAWCNVCKQQLSDFCSLVITLQWLKSHKMALYYWRQKKFFKWKWSSQLWSNLTVMQRKPRIFFLFLRLQQDSNPELMVLYSWRQKKMYMYKWLSQLWSYLSSTSQRKPRNNSETYSMGFEPTTYDPLSTGRNVYVNYIIYTSFQKNLCILY